MVALAALAVASSRRRLPRAVGFLCYLGVVSMFLGFFAWYRGLAIGP